MSKKLFLVTTETSGDLLGAHLLRALLPQVHGLEVRGVAGPRLEALGMEPLYRVRDFNVMGLFEVISQLKRLKGIFRELEAHVRQWCPDVIVLVDAPDFNLRFAKAIRALGIPIIYFVSPQVWAWREKRAESIARLVDHMLVLFSFEVDIYARHGLATTWVGHPLVDEIRDLEPGTRAEFMIEHGLDAGLPLVALVPGSRNSEVNRLLPVMAEVARARMARYQFVLALAPTIDAEHARGLMAPSEIPVLQGVTRTVLYHADAALVASGTATLETALLKTPMIVGYRLKTPTYWMAQMLVKVKDIAMVNIVLGKRVVPELVQHDFNPDKILPLLDGLVRGDAHDRILTEFAKLEELLGGGGAGQRAAQVVEGYLRS